VPGRERAGAGDCGELAVGERERLAQGALYQIAIDGFAARQIQHRGRQVQGGQVVISEDRQQLADQPGAGPRIQDRGVLVRYAARQES
jgi:hypothetical protein